MTQVEIRDMRPDDLEYLRARLGLKPHNEQVDLERAIVGVVEYEGVAVGFVAARLMWQIEPVMLFDEFKKYAPRFARRRATLSMVRWIESKISDPAVNHGIASYFCFITDRVMQKLAAAYGMLRIYTGGKFFGRDL